MFTGKPLPRNRTTEKADRNRLFDVLRIAFATLVLLSHAAELTDGNRSRELLNRITHSGMTFGEVGVDGFFLLSGFLIVQIWYLDPDLSDFLRKRLLRIVPGVAVAALLCVLVIGWVAPGVPHFFRQFHLPFTGQRIKPPVFPGLPAPFMNGSLWTIPYEFRCYLLVALLGLCGFVRRRSLWLLLTVLLLVAMVDPVVQRHLSWRHFYALTGEPHRFFRLTATYFVGGSFYLFRKQIPFHRPLAVAAAVILCILIFVPAAAEPGIVILGGYLMFYFGQVPLPLPSWAQNFPDISYGVYLYGWPVENLWIWFVRGSPWITFLASVPLCFSLGWLSWHFVERPMLKLKRKSHAAAPLHSSVC